MADDPGLPALCLPDCPMSNPAAQSSLCSLCSVQVFCSLLCILMASSSLQGCISLSQGSTTTSVAAPGSLPWRERLSTGPCQGHRNTKGSWAEHQLSLQGKRVGPASKPREGSSPCFRKSQGVTRQVPSSVFSGKFISQTPLSSEAHWQPLSQRHPRLSSSQRKEDSNSSAAYDSKTIFACLWAAFIPSLFLALRFCP